ncbi:MAG TPA: hypothetical protein VH170_05335 [Chthoniobacterales bacterium]|jgi:hypothetical protein|nr:hypothetical protein [Chthoniobacterales bacterium]
MRNSTSARAFVAVLACAAFVWTLVLSVSPQLHERIHHDANAVNHSCAVTIIASGNCDHSPVGPLLGAPAAIAPFSEPVDLKSVWVQPLCLGAHIFAHAPPVVA